MELFELILVLLACVMVSSVLDQIISHMSLPLLQIAIGLVLALILTSLSDVHIDAELFLMLFIAPLLYRDAREVSRLTLWANKWSILSMAVPLVIASVIAAGFMLHWIIPAIPLAAAFACAAALGPTDAAAVAAMSSTVNLNSRQSILLSGEALINDASGVVSFQFAIAAAVTGLFHAGEAVLSFGILFFGGIAVGIVAGHLLKTGMRFLRRRGLVSITTHVIYEVLTPFVLFLVAEEIHVSGILAVVAAGLVMQEPEGNIKSTQQARQQLVSNSFWDVIIFLINGILFVMLGMQLPRVMESHDVDGVSAAIVIGAMLAVTLMIIGIRFAWITITELIRRDPATGDRGTAHPAQAAIQSLVTTIAGPKGAVTLSIILTIPLTTEDGTAFPMRGTIIFITAGVILCTLLLANFVLPLLAPIQHDENEERDLSRARAMVLEKTIREMRRVLDDYADSDFAPALRLAVMRYRVRLLRERLSMESCGDLLGQMIRDTLQVQQDRADEIQKDMWHTPEKDRFAYYAILPAIRESVGYFGGAEKVGSRFETSKGRFLMRFARWRRKTDFDDEKSAAVYYDTVVFAMDLEYAAISYLQRIQAEGDPDRAHIAATLIEEHEAALQSLWGRINYGQEAKMEEIDSFIHTAHEQLPEGMANKTMEQFRKAWHYNDDADANAMQIELEMIRECLMDGSITVEQSRALREQVYLMQAAMLE